MRQWRSSCDAGVIVDGGGLLDSVDGGPKPMRSKVGEGAEGSDGGGAPTTKMLGRQALLQ
jgi:hypothetical protein